MTDPFVRPKQTVAWAKSAIAELHTELAEFFESGQAEYVTDFDTKPGYKIIKIRFREQLPSSAVRKATEALNNTRHAFDQIVYAACAAIGAKPKRDVHFPWGENPTDVRRKLATKGVVPEALWEIIEALEPYPKGEGYAGGNDGIRALAKTANSKHTFGIEPIARISAMIPPSLSGTLLPGQEMSTGLWWNNEKKEMTVATVPVHIPVGNDYMIAADVVFDETTPVRGVPVVPALNEFVNQAEVLLMLLEDKCEELNAAK